MIRSDIQPVSKVSTAILSSWNRGTVPLDLPVGSLAPGFSSPCALDFNSLIAFQRFPAIEGLELVDGRPARGLSRVFEVFRVDTEELQLCGVYRCFEPVTFVSGNALWVKKKAPIFQFPQRSQVKVLPPPPATASLLRADCLLKLLDISMRRTNSKNARNHFGALL